MKQAEARRTIGARRTPLLVVIRVTESGIGLITPLLIGALITPLLIGAFNGPKVRGQAQDFTLYEIVL